MACMSQHVDRLFSPQAVVCLSLVQCACIILLFLLVSGHASSMLSYLRTYLLGDGDVLSRVVLAGLLRVVRYRPLALGELLGLGVGVRHFELLVSLVALGRSQLEGSNIHSADA